MLDVGGGSGGVAIALARACTELRATVVDLPNVTPLMTRNSISVTWLPDDRFWYRVRTGAGSELVLVDPARRTRVVCESTGSNCPGASSITCIVEACERAGL